MPQYIAITAINNIFLTKGFLFPLKFPTLDIFLNLSDLQIRKVQESGNFSSNLLLGFGGGGNRGAEIKKGEKPNSFPHQLATPLQLLSPQLVA